MEKTQMEKSYCLMKFSTPIFEKNKLMKPYERSVLQIQTILAKNDKVALKTFKCNEETHATMKKKYFYHIMPSIYIF